LNRYDLAFKKASAIYKFHKENLDLFASSYVKGKPFTYICMNDKGAKIFELVDDTHLEEIDNIEWSDYRTVEIKIGKIKSKFNFDQKKEITILVEGGEVLKFLQNHTPLDIHIVQNDSKNPFKSWKLWTSVAVLFLLGIIIYSVSNSHDNEPTTNLSQESSKKVTKKTAASTPESQGDIEENKSETSKNDQLEKIEVKFDYQDVFKDDKQKVVVTVHNTSEKVFNGDISIEFLDTSSNHLTGDTILVENLAPNVITTSILWTAPEVAEEKFKINGEFKELPKKQADYEIVSTKPGLNYQRFFVVSKNDTETLKSVVKDIRQQYKDTELIGFTIFFYESSQKEEAKSQNSNSCFADYVYSKESGLSQLNLYSENKTINLND